MNIDFKLTEESKANKFFIHIMYEGGDADTEHPEEYTLPDITSLNYRDNYSVINEELSILKNLQRALSDTDNTYEKVKETFGKKVADYYDNSPNDPQCDYQFKCILYTVKLVKYDDKGNRYESYTGI